MRESTTDPVREWGRIVEDPTAWERHKHRLAGEDVPYTVIELARSAGRDLSGIHPVLDLIERGRREGPPWQGSRPREAADA